MKSDYTKSYVHRNKCKGHDTYYYGLGKSLKLIFPETFFYMLIAAERM